MRTWGVVVATTLGLSACSVLRPTSSPPHYFWDSNLQTKQIHAAVACTSLHALQTFNQLYASGTAKDKLEEATLLGESSFYASDAPPDPSCQRAGHPEGPVTTPGSTDRVKNITASSDVPYPSSGTLPRLWLTRLVRPKPITPIRSIWFPEAARPVVTPYPALCDRTVINPTATW